MPTTRVQNLKGEIQLPDQMKLICPLFILFYCPTSAFWMLPFQFQLSSYSAGRSQPRPSQTVNTLSSGLAWLMKMASRVAPSYGRTPESDPISLDTELA